MLTRKIIATILIVGACILFTGVWCGLHETDARTYTGSQTFSNLSEAVAFQADIGNEANRVNATIDKLALVNQSPPMVSWSILMPATKLDIFGDESLPFKYGDVVATPDSARNSNIFGLIFTPCLLMVSLFLIWRLKPLDFEDNSKNKPNKTTRGVTNG